MKSGEWAGRSREKHGITKAPPLVSPGGKASHAPVDSNIVIGQDGAGQAVRVDLEELLATRLLVQGNSGSGKSHLLRRLLEESAELVQQVVIDPEGDFVTLADFFSHIVIDGATHSEAEIETLALRVREHRASVVLALEGLDVEQQIRCAARFLGALFDAPREHWFPALVVVDEAQMFAPAVAGEINEDTRRMTLGAMTNLMCRGRKRGLAGIVATQRLAKLAKNVAAEASNFLMGRTFLDIDMLRAADLLGMERRQAERIRDLDRGHFLGLGPAICRRPLSVRIGSVRSGNTTKGMSGLIPLPAAEPAAMEALLHADLHAASEPAVRAAKPAAMESAEDAGKLVERIARQETSRPSDVQVADGAKGIEIVLAGLADEKDAPFMPASNLYQTFLNRCRSHGVHHAGIDMADFRRRFSVALANLDQLSDEERTHALQLGEAAEEDLLAPFLVIVRAAIQGLKSPDEDELARAYGTNSPSRIRRLLQHLERRGLITIREDFGGGRTVYVTGLQAVSAA